MAIGIYFSPVALSAAKYDECIKLLKKAGAGNPAVAPIIRCGTVAPGILF
jgi:hypothetical protein